MIFLGPCVWVGFVEETYWMAPHLSLSLILSHMSMSYAHHLSFGLKKAATLLHINPFKGHLIQYIT
jgi:hypothetical protein